MLTVSGPRTNQALEKLALAWLALLPWKGREWLRVQAHQTLHRRCEQAWLGYSIVGGIVVRRGLFQRLEMLVLSPSCRARPPIIQPVKICGFNALKNQINFTLTLCEFRFIETLCVCPQQVLTCYHAIGYGALKGWLAANVPNLKSHCVIASALASEHLLKQSACFWSLGGQPYWFKRWNNCSHSIRTERTDRQA